MWVVIIIIIVIFVSNTNRKHKQENQIKRLKITQLVLILIVFFKYTIVIICTTAIFQVNTRLAESLFFASAQRTEVAERNGGSFLPFNGRRGQKDGRMDGHLCPCARRCIFVRSGWSPAACLQHQWPWHEAPSATPAVRSTTASGRKASGPNAVGFDTFVAPS